MCSFGLTQFAYGWGSEWGMFEKMSAAYNGGGIEFEYTLEG